MWVSHGKIDCLFWVLPFNESNAIFPKGMPMDCFLMNIFSYIFDLDETPVGLWHGIHETSNIPDRLMLLTLFKDYIIFVFVSLFLSCLNLDQ